MKLKSDIATYSEAEFNRGIERGLYTKAIETVRNCLALNMPIEMISKIIGLSIEEIEKL